MVRSVEELSCGDLESDLLCYIQVQSQVVANKLE